MRELPSLLARWHEWRSGFSHERKFERVAVPDTETDDEERLERMLLASVEEEIARMPREHQIALQHVARCEFLASCAVRNPRLPTGASLEKLVNEAKARLWHRLNYLGLI